MKKLLTTTSALILGLSLVSPAFAEKNEEKENVKKIEVANEQKEAKFKYNYKGIEFSGDTELTKDQLSDLYASVMAQSQEAIKTPKSAEIGPMVNDPGSSYVSVIPPTYKTYTNTGTKLAADAITFYLVSKAPKPVQTTTMGAWVLNKLSGWVDSIQPTYVGAWTSTTYDNYSDMRRYYETLVHYQNSNYTTPLSVQYYDVTLWWI